MEPQAQPTFEKIIITATGKDVKVKVDGKMLKGEFTNVDYNQIDDKELGFHDARLVITELVEGKKVMTIYKPE